MSHWRQIFRKSLSLDFHHCSLILRSEPENRELFKFFNYQICRAEYNEILCGFVKCIFFGYTPHMIHPQSSPFIYLIICRDISAKHITVYIIHNINFNWLNFW